MCFAALLLLLCFRCCSLYKKTDAKRAKRSAKAAVAAAADAMDDGDDAAGSDFDFDDANEADGLNASEVGWVVLLCD